MAESVMSISGLSWVDACASALVRLLGRLMALGQCTGCATAHTIGTECYG
jgi:hypothetical protein